MAPEKRGAPVTKQQKEGEKHVPHQAENETRDKREGIKSKGKKNIKQNKTAPTPTLNITHIGHVWHGLAKSKSA